MSLQTKFWNNYPGPTVWHYIQSFITRSAVNTPPYLLPSTISLHNNIYTNRSIHIINGHPYRYYITVMDDNTVLEEDIVETWKTAFNLCDISLSVKTVVLLLRDAVTGHLASTVAAKPFGTIRRNYLQSPMKESLHYIDLFWTAANKRKQGLGDFLLNGIFIQLTSLYGSAPVIFIKEGNPLPKIIPPLYSSIYIYKYIESGRNDPNIQFISQEKAVTVAGRWLGNRTDSLQQQAALPGQQQQQQFYILWKNSILYYITIPQQYGPNGKDHIVWITGMIASPKISMREYSTALNETAEFVTYAFNMKYIWSDIAFLGDSQHHHGWNMDGPFNIYAFQWNPILFGQRINGFFC